MRVLAPFVGILLIVSAVFAVEMLRVSFSIQEFRSQVEGQTLPKEAASILGSDTWTVQINILPGETYYLNGQGSKVGTLSTSPAKTPPDFTVTTNRGAVLSILNAPEPLVSAKRLYDAGVIRVSASDPLKDAALKIAMSTLSEKQFRIGSQSRFGDLNATPESYHGSAFRVTIRGDSYILDKYGSVIGALSRGHDRLSQPPGGVGIFFNQPPGVLAQNPGLVYDTVSRSPSALVGPRDILRVNPGLIGPNDILRLNPGLIGPADIGLLNPNLHGPREFAYVMGIGAHSNTARYLQSQGMVNDPTTGRANRWNLTR
jgi:hypothetical protein